MKVENTLFSVEYKQRAYDGKWMKLGYVTDYENTYRYRSENGREVVVIPMKWIILNVYDYEVEFV